MQPGSHRDRIIEAIRISSRPLDDDQLADRTGISPRQSVNQICRELARAGLVLRRPGLGGKIVNEWLGDHGRQADSGPAASDAGVTRTAVLTDVAAIQAGGESPPGSSREQRDAERVMLDLLSQQLGCVLNPVRLSVPSGERVEVDGADAELSVLVECWAHQGPPKSAQRHKVLADAFKLTWISTTTYPRPRLILCLSDPLAAAPLLARRPFMGSTGIPGPRSLNLRRRPACRAPPGPAASAAPPVPVTMRSGISIRGFSGRRVLQHHKPLEEGSDLKWHRNRRSARSADLGRS